MSGDRGSVLFGSRVFLPVMALLILPCSVMAEEARSPQGPPPNDECVDAIDLASGEGACAVSGLACDSNDDCSMAECLGDGADCTADATVCDDDRNTEIDMII